MELDKNEWILLNSIVYKIYSVKDITKMQKSFLELIRLLIPYDAATFYLSDHESSHLLSHPVGVNISEGELQRYIDCFEEIDYTRWVYLSAKNMEAYRETDFFSDSIREESECYKQLYAPSNLHFIAVLSLASNDFFLGIISLYRTKDKANFSDRDLFVLNMIKDHLTLRLFQEAKIDELLDEHKNEHINDQALSLFLEKCKITQRESEVLQLMLEKYTNEEICNKLFIGSNTLKKHILNIYKKAGVNSRVQLLKLFDQNQK